MPVRRLTWLLTLLLSASPCLAVEGELRYPRAPLGMAAGVLRQADPAAVAAQWWTALHGFVMLEVTRFIDVVDDAEDTVLWPLMDNLLSSLVVTPELPREDA